MNSRTALERMNYSYQIAKKFVEEMEKFNNFDFDCDDVILRFIVIRDYPFLEETEIQTVMNGVRLIVQLALDEKQINERKENEARQIF
ncbi:hypothetical protein DFLDMN_001627 [Cupriavidus sp. H19C3]|uniref:hypothetical protein n=1 Tax=Cupriavidus sp. H19C3 TaxID=3241603 RepID=UPI003BF89C1B